jgi:hypothetical protein
MTVADESSQLGAGDSLHVPADVLYSGGNVGPALGRRLVVFRPAGMENFFLEAGTSSTEVGTDLGEAVASAVRHGWEFTTTA